MRAVIYTRVSTDEQRQASHDDQARNCERVAEREGWHVTHRYTDHGISGSKLNRPQYLAMLEAAGRQEFAVLLIDDLSRFSRDQVECERAMRRLEFDGIRVIAASDGYDSISQSRKIQRGFKGLMNEMFLDDLAKKTHRGLEGKALKGESVGGRAYGYRSEPITDPNGRVIGASVVVNPEQARWVKWIFEKYANGLSPRKIASGLNALGIPAPGSTWSRTERRRDGKWLSSTIYGDPERWSGILHNELYAGIRIWNRSQRVRDPDTGRVIFRRRPESEHQRVEVPSLRIIDTALWEKVRAREAGIRERYGARIALAIKRGKVGRREQTQFARRGLREPKYVFSGLVICHQCKASYVVSGPYQTYRCASHTNGGKEACSNHIMIKRATLEERLFAGIRNEFERPEWARQFEADVTAVLKAQAAVGNDELKHRTERLVTVRAEKINVIKAIKAGIFTPSTKAELEGLEAEEIRLQSEPQVAQVVRMVPRVVERWRAAIRDLPGTLVKSPTRARAELLAMLGGKITLRPDDAGLIAEVPLAAMHNLLNSKGNICIGSGGRI